MREKGRGQRGGATLEMALVIPIFLLLATGLTMIGHALMVRWSMSSAVMVAARTGALTGRRDQSSAQTLVLQRMGAEARACAPLRVAVGQLLLLDTQRTFQVTLDCSFRGGAGGSVLDAFGISPPRMVVSATMPF